MTDDSTRRTFIRSFAGSTAFLAGAPLGASHGWGAYESAEHWGKGTDSLSDILGATRDEGRGRQVVLDVTDFGADPTGDSDSTPAFQAALDEVPDAGGTVYVSPGTYRIDSTIVWPTIDDTDTLRPALFRGDNPSIIKGVPGAWSRGTAAISFTGAGPLLDLRGSEAAETNFSGGIRGVALHGPGRPDTVGIAAFNVKVAQFTNLVVRNFGVNVEVAGESFYSVWEDCMFSDAVRNGAEFQNDLNGSGFSRCRFAANGGHGIRVANGGFPVWFHGCWSEANQGYGLWFENTIEAQVAGSYLEGNDQGSIRFNGVPGPDYRSTISLTHSYCRPDEGAVALTLGDNPVAIRLIGNSIDSTKGAKSVLDVSSRGRHSVLTVGTIPVGGERKIPLFSGDPNSLESVVAFADECAREDEHLGSANILRGNHGVEIHDEPVTLPVLERTQRPPPGSQGRVFFNQDDQTLNIDTGDMWVRPDGSRA